MCPYHPVASTGSLPASRSNNWHPNLQRAKLIAMPDATVLLCLPLPRGPHVCWFPKRKPLSFERNHSCVSNRVIWSNEIVHRMTEPKRAWRVRSRVVVASNGGRGGANVRERRYQGAQRRTFSSRQRTLWNKYYIRGWRLDSPRRLPSLVASQWGANSCSLPAFASALVVLRAVRSQWMFVCVTVCTSIYDKEGIAFELQRRIQFSSSLVCGNQSCYCRSWWWC